MVLAAMQIGSYRQQVCWELLIEVFVQCLLDTSTASHVG